MIQQSSQLGFKCNNSLNERESERERSGGVPWDGELCNHHSLGRRNPQQQVYPLRSIGSPQDLVQRSPLSCLVEDPFPTISEFSQSDSLSVCPIQRKLKHKNKKPLISLQKNQSWTFKKSFNIQIFER